MRVAALPTQLGTGALLPTLLLAQGVELHREGRGQGVRPSLHTARCPHASEAPPRRLFHWIVLAWPGAGWVGSEAEVAY